MRYLGLPRFMSGAVPFDQVKSFDALRVGYARRWHLVHCPARSAPARAAIGFVHLAAFNVSDRTGGPLFLSHLIAIATASAGLLPQNIAARAAIDPDPVAKN